jgi:hypothetical protein
VHSTLLHKWLTPRGKNIGRRQSEASAERQASGVAAAKLIAAALHDRFDVAATYGLGSDLSVHCSVSDSVEVAGWRRARSSLQRGIPSKLSG